MGCTNCHMCHAACCCCCCYCWMRCQWLQRDNFRWRARSLTDVTSACVPGHPLCPSACLSLPVSLSSCRCHCLYSLVFLLILSASACHLQQRAASRKSRLCRTATLLHGDLRYCCHVAASRIKFSSAACKISRCLALHYLLLVLMTS